MDKNIVETLIGALVLLVAITFVVFAYQSAGSHAVAGYPLIAKFDNVGGLSQGGDVKLGGIKVGTITSQVIDPKTYQAVVTLSVDNAIKLPKDSSAEVASDSLLGGKHIALVPGGDSDMLAPNAEIKFTQSSVSLEDLIGKFMFSSADKDKNGGGKDKAASLNSFDAPTPPQAPAPGQAPAPNATNNALPPHL